MSANAGSVLIQIGADIATLRENMQQTKAIFDKNMGDMRSIAKGAAAGIAGYFTVDMIKDSIKSTLDLADSLNKMSQKVGMSTDTLYSLQAAGKLADVDIQGLTTSLGKFNKNLGEVSMGAGDEAANALKNLGISIKDASGNFKSSDAVLMEVSDKFQNMPDGVNKTTLAMKLFGKSGAELIPLLNGGGESLKEFSGIMDEQTGKAAERLNDSFTRLHIATESGMLKTMAKTVPTMDAVSGAIEHMAAKGSLVGAFGEDIATMFKYVAKGGMGTITVFEMLGAHISGLSAAASAALHGDFQGAEKAYADAKYKAATYKAEYTAFLNDLEKKTDSATNSKSKKDYSGLVDFKKGEDELKKFVAFRDEMMQKIAGNDLDDPFLKIAAEQKKNIDKAKELSPQYQAEATRLANDAASAGAYKLIDELTKKDNDQLAGLQSTLATSRGDYVTSLAEELNKQIVELDKSMLDPDKKQKAKELAGSIYSEKIAKEDETRLSRFYHVSGNYAAEWAIKEKNIRNEIFGLTQEQQDAILEFEKRNFDESIAMDTSRLKSMKTAAEGAEFWSKKSIASLQNEAEKMNSLLDGVAGSMESAFESTFDGIIKGTLSTGQVLQSFADDVLKELWRIYVVKQLVAGATSAIGSFFNASSSTNSIDGSGAGTDQAGTLTAADFNVKAKGGAYSNGIEFFAQGGTFTNQIVSKPTMFKYGGGLGVMGEAGAEAIMPLTRAADGSLGVRSVGSAGGDMNVKIEIINQSGEDTKVTKTSSKNDMGELVVSVWIDKVSRNQNGSRDAARAALGLNG